MKQQSFRGFGFILLMLVLIFMAMIVPSNMLVERLSHQEFMAALDSGRIENVRIEQNRETPTGEVSLQMKDTGDEYVVYVSDVKETQTLLEERDIDYIVFKTKAYDSVLRNLNEETLTQDIQNTFDSWFEKRGNVFYHGTETLANVVASHEGIVKSAQNGVALAYNNGDKDRVVTEFKNMEENSIVLFENIDYLVNFWKKIRTNN